MSRLLSPGLALGHDIPLLIYGTAWKDDKTTALVATALERGFKGIDTANHPTGYDERRAGEGIAAALASGIKRENLFAGVPSLMYFMQNARENGLLTMVFNAHRCNRSSRQYSHTILRKCPTMYPKISRLR